MQLTKKRAIELHRELWNYIADETERTHRCISKGRALQALGFEPDEVSNMCFCCEYAQQHSTRMPFCDCCPINWPTGDCMGDPIAEDGLYTLWSHAYVKQNWKEAVQFARQIADLPKRRIKR